MFTVPVLLAALAMVIVASFVTLLFWYFAVKVAFVPWRSNYGHAESLVFIETTNVFYAGFDSVLDIGAQAGEAIAQSIALAWNYVLVLLVSAIVAALCTAVLVHHKDMIEEYHVIAQCGVAPVRDNFIMVLVNFVALVYDIAIPIWNIYMRMRAFLEVGWIPLVFGCSGVSFITEIIAELGYAFRALVKSPIDILLSDDPLEERLDLTPAFYHVGRAFASFNIPFDCLCEILDFIYEHTLRTPSYVSLHVGVDCAVNAVVRLIQAILKPFFGKKFALSPMADELGCFALSAGDYMQAVLLAYAQMFTGIFSEISTPCEVFLGDERTCSAIGRCFFDVLRDRCRTLGRCDAYGSRETCSSDTICCFSAVVNNVTRKVSFACGEQGRGQCPADVVTGCAAITTSADCLAFNGTCLWDGRNDTCVKHADVCIGLEGDDCKFTQSYCAAFSLANCSTLSKGLCAANGGQCVSHAELCYHDPLLVVPDRNLTCASYQLCGWNETITRFVARNTTTNTTFFIVNETTTRSCISRDLNDTRRLNVNATVAAARHAVQMALNIPGADGPPDTIGKLLGVPVLLAAFELQWMHANAYVVPNIALMRLLVLVVDNIADPQSTFGSYEGLANWKVGHIFDYLRTYLFPYAQVGILIDANLPCSIQGILQVIPDALQGIVELFLLLIYFSVFQPTGPANAVNAWLPLDFVSSYYNDTRVSFMPLIFINNTVWQLDRVNSTYYRRCVPDGSEHGKRTRACNPDNSTHYYDVEVDTALDLIYLRSSPSIMRVYNWTNVSLSNTTVRRVYIFPGMDRTLPRIIRNIQQAGVCIERVLGDGSNLTEDVAPWACFVRHLLNFYAEILNVFLQAITYSSDIIRFTDDPIYRHTALDVSFEGIFAEWEAATHCLANIIRLGDPDGAGIYGRCVSDNPTVKSDGSYDRDRSSILCCLASFVEAVLNGALVVTFNEIMLFVRDFMGSKFKAVGSPSTHLPNFNLILNKIEILIDKLACTIANFIPPSWKCNMILEFEAVEAVDENVTCRVISELGKQVPCGYMQCKKGNECVAKFLSAAIRFVALVIPRAFNLIYSTIRRLILNGISANAECTRYDTVTLCENNDCQWKITPTSKSCILPTAKATAGTAGALQAIVEMLSSLLTILATGGFAVFERLALVFDCISCATRAAEAGNLDMPCVQGSGGLSDPNSGTPFFNFVVFLLAPIINIMTSVVKLVVTLFIFWLVIVVIVFSGQFDALEVMFDSFGSSLEATVNRIGQNFLGIFLKVLKLDEFYNSVVTIINDIVLVGCHFINDACDDLSLGCHLECTPPLKGIPTGTSESYPETVCADFTNDDHSCNAWGVQCMYETDTGTCRKRVGCELGLARDLCASVIGCIWRTTTNRTLTLKNVRAKECVNVSAIGMTPLADAYVNASIQNMPVAYSFNHTACAGLNSTQCVTQSVCAYDANETFCYHRAHAQLCERYPGNQTIRGTMCLGEALNDPGNVDLNDVRVCRGMYEANLSAADGGTSDESCVAHTVTIPGSADGEYTLCVRAQATPCNFYSTANTCNAWSGLCYWSESTDTCLSGRELCMSHESDAASCRKMTNLCGFADGDQNACVSTQALSQLCTYDTALNTCVSRAHYCANNESNVLCGTYFSCVWDPLGASVTKTPLFGTNVSFPKPRCIPIDMMERIVKKPLLRTNNVLGDAFTAFYQRSKRGVTMDRDVLKRVVAQQTAPKQMVWTAGDSCATVMQAEGETAAARIDAIFGSTFDVFGEYMYCFGRQLWTMQSQPFVDTGRPSVDPALLRSLGATGTLGYPEQTTLLDKMTQGECDILYSDYYNASKPMPWSDLRPLERVSLVECSKQRVYGMYLRQLAGYTWLPEDLIDNPYRKYVLLVQAFRVLRIHGVYRERFALMPETLLSPVYAKRLSDQNMATLDLVGLETVDDVKAMLLRVSLVDYFAYNGLDARDVKMASDLHALFGDSLGSVGKSLSEVFARVPFNASHVTLGDLFANGTKTTLAQVAVTSLAGSASALFEAVNTSVVLATDPLTYKRAIFASVAMGRLMYDASMTALVWLGRINGTNTTLGDGVSPVNAPPFNSTTTPDPVPDPDVTSSSFDIFKNTMGNRIGIRLAAARDLLWRNPEAAVRREKLAIFGENIIFTLRAQLFIPLMIHTPEERITAYVALRNATRPMIVNYHRTRAAFSERFDTTLNGLFDPVPCLTNSSGFIPIGTDWICDNCPWLDALLGRLIAWGLYVVRYFRGRPSDNLYSNFPASFERYNNYSKYVTNDTAPVRVGDSYENPMRWPYHNRSSMHLLGDSTPNKTRLYEYEALMVELVESLKLGITDETSETVINLIDRGFNALWVRVSGTFWTAAIHASYYLGAVSNVTLASLSQDTPEWREVKLATVRPVGTVLNDLGGRLFNRLIMCSAPIFNEDGELDGSKKSFSIAEGIAVGLLIIIVFVVPLTFFFPNSLMSLSSAIGIVTTLVGVSFLCIVYGWSYLCSPALPTPLADDVRDFLGFNLSPKCNVLLSGTFIGEYNATNCYSCDNARQVRSIHCVRDLHITSIIDDVALVAIIYYPELPQTLRDLGLGAFIDVNSTLGASMAKFTLSFDRNDPESYSQHAACIVWTGLPYLGLMQFAAILFILAAPMLFLALRAALIVYKLLMRAVAAQMLIINYINYVADSYPYAETYNSTPEDDVSLLKSTNTDDAYGGGQEEFQGMSEDQAVYPITAYRAMRNAATDNAMGLVYSTLRNRFAAAPPVQAWPLQQVNVPDALRQPYDILADLRGDNNRQGF